MRTNGPVQPLVSGFATLEGPAFDRDENLFFVDWETSRIMKLTPEGALSEFFHTGGIPAGLAFHPDGSLYVADEGDSIHGVLRITPDRECTTVVDRYDGRALNGANDLVFAQNGTLYFSDPWGSNAEQPKGAFYRLSPAGALEQIDAGLAFPNGLALAADESAIYLAETYRNQILRYALAPDGAIGARDVWAETARPPGPDGMALDVDGYLYCAHFSASQVDVFAPDGTAAAPILVPGAKPTNVAFGGPDNRTLVITEVETGTVYTVAMVAPGLSLNDGIQR